MATGVVSWSQTAATNASADSTVNWAEGQAPSTVNDSARAVMASVAKYRDDISGAITTGGTSTAYTVSSNQGFGSFSAITNQIIAFTPHTTCSSPVTLNVDSLGAKPLRSAPGVELPAGTIIQGTPYLALYNSSDSAFYLQSFFGNPYGVPIGAVIDFSGFNAPNSSFVLPYGQAISRTTYASYFAMVSTQYGSGDGSTTFNIPDLRGRVIAGRDDMGGSAASRLTSSYFGSAANNLGASGGAESLTLTANQIPSITAAGSGTLSATTASSVVTGVLNGFAGASSPGSGGGWCFNNTAPSYTIVSISGTTSVTTTSNNTGGLAHRTVQPTIVLNKLIRII